MSSLSSFKLVNRVQYVAPEHFYTAPSEVRGLGPFSKVDLLPGDIGFLSDLNERRYGKEYYQTHTFGIPQGWTDNPARRSLVFFDFQNSALVLCNEPFCRVNHSFMKQNSSCDEDHHSVIVAPVPAHTEIFDPYDYDAVALLPWKFPHLKEWYQGRQLSEPDLLRTPAAQDPVATEFLRQF